MISSIRVEWLPLMGDGHFGNLWETGVFQQINRACAVEIGDYEEAILQFDQIEMAMNIVQQESESFLFSKAVRFAS